MTTHVSRERREAVAENIWQNAGNGWFARAHPEGFAGRPESIRDIYLGYADAALAAALPDRAAFTGLLDDLVCSATEYGNATPNSEREARASYEASEARDALIALIYGADDAQAGDQEGAEQ